MKPKAVEGITQLESSPGKTLQLDYYRNKNNGIERHLDDALTILLATLTRCEQKHIDSLIQSQKRGVVIGATTTDALDIKRPLKTEGLPSIHMTESIESYAKQVEEAFDQDKHFEKQIKGLSDDEITALTNTFEQEDAEWAMYTQELNQKFSRGESPIMSYGNQSIIKTPGTTHCVARINIKVPETVSPYQVVMELAKKFSNDKTVVANGFQMKSLTGTSSDRDGVIIYSSEEAFASLCSIVTDHFRDDFHYHDRHADPAIFGGVALEDVDGSKFPSIRVSAEPESINQKLGMTFNDLQATLLSEAVLEYLALYYEGNKLHMLHDFIVAYDEAYEKWCQEFPKLYRKAVVAIVGPEAKCSNIAFF